MINKLLCFGFVFAVGTFTGLAWADDGYQKPKTPAPAPAPTPKPAPTPTAPAPGKTAKCEDQYNSCRAKADAIRDSKKREQEKTGCSTNKTKCNEAR